MFSTDGRKLVDSSEHQWPSAAYLGALHVRCHVPKRTRSHVDTTPPQADAERRPRGRPGPPPLSLAPLTVDEALSALLRTPPPPKGEQADKAKRGPKSGRRKRR
jgi:hypothetical protein